MILSGSGLTKIQGGETLYQEASFQINPGEKVGLVGPNGAGKTTLFRMIIGEERADAGQISKLEKVRLSYFSQSVGEMSGRSALQEVLEGDAELVRLTRELKELEEKICDPDLSPDEMDKLLIRMGDVQTEFEKRGGYELEYRAEEILTGLGIAPEFHHKNVEFFSGGQKMRIALARTLVTYPDLILMDEPTNYLDIETILWLEEWLKNFKGSVLMTTHDRDFMNNVVGKIIEVAGKKFTTYNGNYDFYLKEKDIRRTQLVAEFERQKEMLAKEEEFIAKFKARASHAAQVQSRVKKLEKIERVELPPEEQTISFEFPNPPRGGDDVIIIDDLAKSWPSENGPKKIFEGLSATIKRLEKIAIVGVNGAGKSTLLKVICQKTEPTHGSVTIGPSIKLGYFGQYTLDNLDPEATVMEEVRSKLPSASDGFLRNLLASFLFQGSDAEKKVRHLSGGERARVILAYLFAQGNNLLVLDEPTNHLDIKSREILMEALKGFEGTLLFVSHDRHFLHALTEKVIEVDREHVNLYPGNYKYYLEKKGQL